MYTAAAPLTSGYITSVGDAARISASATSTSERGATLITLGTSSTAGQSYWTHWVADARI